VFLKLNGIFDSIFFWGVTYTSFLGDAPQQDVETVTGQALEAIFRTQAKRNLHQ
jgi:hypothetical protein